MQNRYVGDAGDFGKYGLLRALCGYHSKCEKELSLGIVWYLTDPEDLEEEENKDGKHRGYLSDKHGNKYRQCDEQLFDAMKKCVPDENGRIKTRPAVTAIHKEGIFRRGTVFMVDILTGQNRQQWLNKAHNKTEGKDMIFVDPDNGILEIKNNSPKHVFLDELKSYLDRGQTLVVYHHASRQGTVLEQAARWKNIISKNTGGRKIWPLIYRRGSCRIYFIIPSNKHQRILKERLVAFKKSPWVGQKHFELAFDL